MRFAHTDDQLVLADAVAHVLAKELGDGPDHEGSGVSSALAAMGVAGVCVADAHGGMGGGLLEAEAVLEALGRRCVIGPWIDTIAVAPQLLVPLTPHSTDAAGLLEALVAGERSVSVAAPPLGGTRRAEPCLVEQADAILVLDGDRLRCMEGDALDAAAQQVEVVDPGRRVVCVDAEALAEVGVDLGRVAAADRARASRAGAVATAAVLVGLADTMLAMTVDYAGQRRQFGVPIGSFQAVKHHLADAALALGMARPVVWHGAAILAGAPADPAHPLPAEPTVAAAMAKAAASDAARAVAAQALQCHGAIGYTVEHDLHRYLKRTWALCEVWGSAAAHRELIARRLIDDEPDPAEVPDA